MGCAEIVGVNCQIHRDSSDNCFHWFFNLILFWSENTLDGISVFSNVPLFILWASQWSVLVGTQEPLKIRVLCSMAPGYVKVSPYNCVTQALMPWSPYLHSISLFDQLFTRLVVIYTLGTVLSAHKDVCILSLSLRNHPLLTSSDVPSILKSFWNQTEIRYLLSWSLDPFIIRRCPFLRWFIDFWSQLCSSHKWLSSLRNRACVVYQSLLLILNVWHSYN